jgi:hypothetical protein
MKKGMKNFYTAARFISSVVHQDEWSAAPQDRFTALQTVYFNSTLRPFSYVLLEKCSSFIYKQHIIDKFQIIANLP